MPSYLVQNELTQGYPQIVSRFAGGLSVLYAWCTFSFSFLSIFSHLLFLFFFSLLMEVLIFLTGKDKHACTTAEHRLVVEKASDYR